MFFNKLSGAGAVVAYDAGGAEILISLLEDKKFDALLVLDGPAIKIFKQRLGNINVISLTEALSRCEWFLTGTGWQSDFEWQAIRQGRMHGVHVISYLDHWVNYSMRFTRIGKTCLPNEMWVGDDYAYNIVKLEFPTQPVTKVDNPYFKHFLRDITRLDRINAAEIAGNYILYVCENISRDNFDQHEAIEYFFNNLDCLNEDFTKVIIRPHPSEQYAKYEWVAKKYGEGVKISKGSSLVEDMTLCNVVVGCSSMAMALAVMAGRRVISCIPDQKVPLTIPYDEIEIFSDIIDRSKSRY